MKKLFEFELDGKKLFIRKPTRQMFDDADLFYSVELSKGIKAGLLTNAQLQTKFSDEIASISEREQKRYATLVKDLMAAESEYQLVLGSKKDEDLNDEEKKKLSELLSLMIEKRAELTRLEQLQSSLFEHTADSRAKYRTILWWTLALSYVDGEKLFYGSGDFQSRMDTYNDFSDEDDENSFTKKASQRFLYLVSFWYTGKANEDKDFKLVLDFFDKQAAGEGAGASEKIVEKPEDKTEPVGETGSVEEKKE